MHEARGKLEAASPEARQAFVRAILEPGSVVIGDESIEATMVIGAAEVESNQLIPAGARVDVLRIRVVA